MLTKRQIIAFQTKIGDFYQINGRDMPWRKTSDPYKILVSEIMLQQTQVVRVIPKYDQFIARFPTVERLAEAELGEVIKLWSGLGYNRRAKFLWQCSRIIAEQYFGVVPADEKNLIVLPGIGKNTAKAILTYAFNVYCPFIETNIRTVIIHHFFNEDTTVSDAQIMEILEIVTPKSDTREFFWGMMDYGSYLKQTQNNISRSKHYKKQSKFSGSVRQIRGNVIRYLTEKERTVAELSVLIPDERLSQVLESLVKEQMIKHEQNRYLLF